MSIYDLEPQPGDGTVPFLFSAGQERVHVAKLGLRKPIAVPKTEGKKKPASEPSSLPFGLGDLFGGDAKPSEGQPRKGDDEESADTDVEGGEKGGADDGRTSCSTGSSPTEPDSDCEEEPARVPKGHGKGKGSERGKRKLQHEPGGRGDLRGGGGPPKKKA